MEGIRIVELPPARMVTSGDGGDENGERVYAEIMQYIRDSSVFALDNRPDHYTTFHVITSDEAFSAMGLRQLDMFVPIRILHPVTRT